MDFRPGFEIRFADGGIMTLGHIVFAVHAYIALTRTGPVRDDAALFRKPAMGEAAGGEA